jgi:hypothetical protein
VDLRTISQLILNDLGATLQILRQVGREYPDVSNRPARIEDCVAAMEVESCIEAMCSKSIAMKQPSQAMSDLSSHSKEIGLRCRRIAEQTVEVNPDSAHYVGLCHSIGSLPEVLGWKRSRNAGYDKVSTSLEMADEWCLPVCVTDYFHDLQKGSGPSPWPEIVRAAHRCANVADGGCRQEAKLHRELLWAV